MIHLFFCSVFCLHCDVHALNLSVGAGFRGVNIKTNLKIFPGVLNFKHEYLREIADAQTLTIIDAFYII